MDALVRLTHIALQLMLARRTGWILNIASLAGCQPVPYMSVYGATKAFVLEFSLSLWEEVRRKGVVVTCVCPGPVKTGFFSRGGFEARMEDFTRLSATADWVAEEAYWALVNGRPVFIPGRLNRVSAFLQRFVPMKVVTKLAGKVLRPRTPEGVP
jgi:short-subunit dehydrogenase